ncbi:MAG: phospholipase D-like domain-containing protein [Pseudomonadota bacterium]
MTFELWHLFLLASASLLGLLFMLVLAEPGLPYDIGNPLPSPENHEFMGLIAALVDAPVAKATSIEVLTDAVEFYPQELASIARARRSVHLEAYIFHVSAVADRLVDLLTERARAGVRVRLVIDAIGSWRTPTAYFDGLRAAGGEVAWYQPVRWHTLKRFNNRTHRELIVIDGDVAFVGGAGIAYWWDTGPPGQPPWRDTMVRLEGTIVTSVQAAFAENWLESTGQLLTDPGSFTHCRAVSSATAGGADAIVVTGTPSAGRATRARMLFQLLIAGARRSIRITSPYFLPDRSMQAELQRAVRRGVRVQVVVPGAFNNHPIARRASRRRYGNLLGAGVELLEYEPGMNHSKVLLVDELWVVVGSSNFDNRSFGLNDEINLALPDRALAARLREDFERDAALSRPVDLHSWRTRPMSERLLALLGALVERQQ